MRGKSDRSLRLTSSRRFLSLGDIFNLVNRVRGSATLTLLTLPTPKRPTAPPWSNEEIDQLRSLILEGKSVHAVSRHLGRTPQAIRKIASRLKLPLRIV